MVLVSRLRKRGISAPPPMMPRPPLPSRASGTEADDAGAVDLVGEVMAQCAAGVADPEIISRRVVSSVPAATMTTRAFMVISRCEWRSMKMTPSARPVFLSTVIWRTIALGIVVSLPVATASGMKQIDRCGQAVLTQRGAGLGDGNAQLLAGVDKALHGTRPRRIVFDEVAVRVLRQAVCVARHAEDLFHARVVRARGPLAEIGQFSPKPS